RPIGVGQVMHWGMILGGERTVARACMRRARPPISRTRRPAFAVLTVTSSLVVGACAPAQPGSPPFVDVTEASNIAYRVGFTRPALIRGQRAVTESTFGGAA